jgi:glycine cleavage system H protein
MALAATEEKRMYPDECKYTKEHEWIRKDGDAYSVGITSYAADQLGDVTFVELPAVGNELKKGDSAAAVESVKAASDVYAPAGGKVSAINDALEGAPEKVNQDAFGEGWFFKLTGVDENELNGLMDAQAYEAYVNAQED